jgi:hypothetical protein
MRIYLTEEAALWYPFQKPSVSYRLVSCCVSGCSTQRRQWKARAQACAERKDGQPDPVKCDKERQQGIHTIRGEVLHLNGARLLVKQTDGEEAIFHIDLSTQMSGHIGPGSRIEANVNEVEGKKYALSISLIP